MDSDAAIFRSDRGDTTLSNDSISFSGGALDPVVCRPEVGLFFRPASFGSHGPGTTQRLLRPPLEPETLRFVPGLPLVAIGSVRLSGYPPDSSFGEQMSGEPPTAGPLDSSSWGTTQKPQFGHPLHETLRTKRELTIAVPGTVRFTGNMPVHLEAPQEARTPCPAAKLALVA